ncbi:VWA domain-containing protein [Labrys neptuniae]
MRFQLTSPDAAMPAALQDRIAVGRWSAAIVAAFPDLADRIEAAASQWESRVGSAGTAPWQGVVGQLLHANLGASALDAFAELSLAWPPAASAGDLILLGQTALHIGRCCGSAPAGLMLRQWRRILHHSRAVSGLEGYCLGLERLAEAAPDAIGVVLEKLPALIVRAGDKAFFAWIHAGLRACGHDKVRKLAFFDLSDAFSRQLLDQDLARNDLTRLEKRLRGGLLALWGERRQVGALERTPSETQAPLRLSLAGGILRFPVSFPGYEDGEASAIYRAAAAHAGAHYRFSTAKFPVGKLKPLQVALVSLIEDARVEALAIAQFPGLRRLWLRFHAQTGQRGRDLTATGLMARLARALIDPAYVDEDGWVVKGRALFEAARECLDDPQISREIGGLLGNDLGQMRVQFNPKTYVVQPAYRDDTLALWDFGDQPNSPQDTIELEVESIGARSVEGAEASDEPSEDEQDAQSPPRLAAAENDMDGAVIATYPEWDYSLGVERPDWVIVRHREPRPGRIAAPGQDAIEGKIGRITRGTPIGRRVRRKRLREGEIIDLDAAIESALARRMGQMPDERIFQRSIPGPRDLAALLLVDLSQSTADRDGEGRSVLALELEAATAIGRAMTTAGDSLAIDGFCSDGRTNVHYTPLKGFSEPFDGAVAARLAGAESGYSTRLGAALRHAASRLEHRHAFRRVLVLLSDGEPSDIDVTDADYLKEDARIAVHGLRRRGIDAFAFGIGSHASAALVGIFGSKRTLRVAHAANLPKRLMQLYEELKK